MLRVLSVYTLVALSVFFISKKSFSEEMILGALPPVSGVEEVKEEGAVSSSVTSLNKKEGQPENEKVKEVKPETENTVKEKNVKEKNVKVSEDVVEEASPPPAEPVVVEVDPCEAYKASPPFYSVCQDQIKKRQRMQDVQKQSRDRRIEKRKNRR